MSVLSLDVLTKHNPQATYLLAHAFCFNIFCWHGFMLSHFSPAYITKMFSGRAQENPRDQTSRLIWNLFKVGRVREEPVKLSGSATWNCFYILCVHSKLEFQSWLLFAFIRKHLLYEPLPLLPKQLLLEESETISIVSFSSGKSNWRMRLSVLEQN